MFNTQQTTFTDRGFLFNKLNINNLWGFHLSSLAITKLIILRVPLVLSGCDACSDHTVTLLNYKITKVPE